MSEQRARVVEWRITTHHSLASGFKFSIRYWIERDPEHGGIAYFYDALRAVTNVEEWELQTVLDHSMSWILATAKSLLEKIPSANSVEVCDADGNGVAIHRDWP